MCMVQAIFVCSRHRDRSLLSAQYSKHQRRLTTGWQKHVSHNVVLTPGRAPSHRAEREWEGREVGDGVGGREECRRGGGGERGWERRGDGMGEGVGGEMGWEA